MLSPRTQMLQQGQASGTMEDIFRDQFEQLALQQASMHLPGLANYVIGFKVIDARPEKNSATGALYADVNGVSVHVPIVLAENELQPLDMMYVAELESIVPISDSWIRRLQSMSHDSLGKSVPAPDHLSSDRDIRNVVIPPTTGRYSYASQCRARFNLRPDDWDPSTLNHLKKASDLSNERRLLDYLSRASNAVKRSFELTLESRPKIAKHIFGAYPREDIARALRRHAITQKTALENDPNMVQFLDGDASAEDLKEAFPGETATAMQLLAAHGFLMKDTRERDGLRAPIAMETTLRMEQPSLPGFYRVYFSDGSSRPALVFSKVITCDDNFSISPRPLYSYSYGGEDSATGDRRTRILLFDDRSAIMTDAPFVAIQLDADNIPESFRGILNEKRARTPRNGQQGFFCKADGDYATAMEPLKIERVRTENGIRYVTGITYTGRTVSIIQNPKSPLKNVRMLGERETHRPYSTVGPSWEYMTEAQRKKEESRPYYERHTMTVLVPGDYVFVPVTGALDSSELAHSPERIMAIHHEMLTGAGAALLSLRSMGSGDYAISSDGGDAYGVYASDKRAAAEKITEMGVHADYVHTLLKRADARQSHGDGVDFLLVNRSVITKLAQDPATAQAMAANDATAVDPAMADPAIDPAMADPAMADPAMAAPPAEPAMMDPAMAAPPAGGPSPVDLAAQEIMEQVIGNYQEVERQLQLQQQAAELQIATLQAVVTRAGEIAGEMQGMAPQGQTQAPPPIIVPPEASMTMEQFAPVPEEEATALPVEESMAMEESLAPGMEDAFDSSAISSIASHNDFDTTVMSYLPDLEESMDKLGRLLLELRMKRDMYRERMGESAYDNMAHKLKTLFDNLGSSIPKLIEAAEPGQDESIVEMV